MSLKEKILFLINNKGIAQAKIAKAIGKSSAMVSQWLSDKYTGDVVGLESALESYYTTVMERDSQVTISGGFQDIANARKAFALFRIAHLDHEFGILASDSGFGKSTSLREYASRYPGTIVITANPTYNPRHLVRRIHKALGRSGVGTHADLMEDCIDLLRGSDRLIIVDEADQLNATCIEILRSFHDEGGIGVVVAGLPKLVETIRGVRSKHPQLYTRTGASYRLGKLSKNDAEILIRAIQSDIDAATVTALYECSAGNPRTLNKLMRASIRIAERNHRSVDADIVRKATGTLEV